MLLSRTFIVFNVFSLSKSPLWIYAAESKNKLTEISFYVRKTRIFFAGKGLFKWRR